MKCLDFKHRKYSAIYRKELSSKEQRKLIAKIQESDEFFFRSTQPKHRGGGGYVLDGTEEPLIGTWDPEDAKRVIAYVGKDYVKIYSVDNRPGLEHIDSERLVVICEEVVNSENESM